LIAGTTAALKTLAWLLAAEGIALASPDAGSTEPVAPPTADEAQGPNRACLDDLRAKQVVFVEWPTKGVRSPVRITGAIGAIRLRSHDPRATGLATPLMDCELARALLDAAPAFRTLGIRELLFSGTYQYRTRRRSTKLSEHAHGLAIDVHAFAVDAAVLADADAGAGARGGPVLVDVQHDFEAQVGVWAVTDQDSCIGHPHTNKGRLLRTLACRLRASSIFREVITPDDNADHYNHFHLEAFPDALTRTRAVLARKPTVIDD
jgi:hypothetical protein